MTTMDKTASGAMGAVKDVKATFKGLSGVFKHLMEEHGNVGALIKRVAGSDIDARERLYPEIRRKLLAHETGELKAVYPVLAQHPETQAIAREHADQAGELRSAIDQVDAYSMKDDAWSDAFAHLKSLVEQHVDREENDYFPKAQKVIGDERAEQMRIEFEAAKSSD